jgi:hypothetical protein
MNEHSVDALEARSRALFDDSVEGLDMATRSRLTRARHAALDAAARHRGRRFFGLPLWTPAFGVAAAALLAVSLWFASPMSERSPVAADTQTSFEDLDIVASTDEMDLLQDDLEFYDWADRAENPDSGSVG